MNKLKAKRTHKAGTITIPALVRARDLNTHKQTQWKLNTHEQTQWKLNTHEQTQLKVTPINRLNET